MISEVVMPQMGADMTEGTLLRWLKNEGEAVTRGEVIAEIETDKANVEIEAFDGGIFRAALAHEGDVVQVGDVIAVIAGAEDDISKYARTNGAAPAAQQAAVQGEPSRTGKGQTAPPTPPSEATQPETKDTAPPGEQPPTPAAPQSVPSPQPHAPRDAPQTPSPARAADQVVPQTPSPAARDSADGRVRASPLARKIAEQRGVDLASLRGSGPGGRIVRKDVEGAPAAAQPRAAAPAASQGSIAAAQAPGADTAVTPSKMRQAIARRMSASKREAPHYYLLIDIDMTDALAFRAQLNEAVGETANVSINDLIVRASALALQRHPAFNATIENDQVTQRAEQHICIGVALDEGLIAPAIVGAGRMTLVQLAAAAKDLIDRAKNGRLRAEEMSAGTFTISNLGAFGVETLVAIIQPPQTAILGVGAVAPQAVVRDGDVVVRSMMKVALSADHRVTDGAQGAQFLAEIKGALEKPLLLVV
jgi:pyruvate dehydrogenase E2 component (dihydrolipoamide acetyltransferase)